MAGLGSSRTRRGFLGGLLSGAAATAAASLLPDGIVAEAEAAPFLTADFTRRRDGDDWSGSGVRWFSRFGPRVSVTGGRGRIAVPTPLASAADSQPISVFLLDHDSAQPSQRVEFAIGVPDTRPGVILGATSLEAYLAVTVEEGELVLSRFERTRRVVLHRAPGRTLRVGQAYTLDVRVTARRVRARIGEQRALPSVFSLDAGATVTKGMPGVLVVAGPPMGRSALAVSRYELAGPTGAATPIRPTYLLTGTPVVSQGETTVHVRVGAERVCQVVIQHASDPGFGSSLSETAPVTVTAPSYTTKTAIPVRTSVWWRAVLTDPRSGTQRTTRAQHVTPPDPGEPLVMGAASCAQLWNAKGYHGLTRFVNEAAPVRAAMLVYQGDYGYPSNSVNSCLRAEPDFYVDRITRFLRSPDFINLRAEMPVGFTMDDHEYGPQNNSDRTTLYPWTVDLWNSMHADPSDLGYCDWRFGDVHCLTLDGRRYCDPASQPESPSKTKLGVTQKQWLRQILETTDAQLIVIFSADIFATRGNTLPQIDCWW